MVPHPWDAETLFPAAPSRDTYGYLSGDRTFRTTTRDDLIKICRTPPPPNHQRLVWTPEHSHLVPPTEVPMLQPAVMAALRSAITRSVGTSAFWGVVGLVVLMGKSSASEWAFLAIFFLVPSLQEMADQVILLRALRRREYFGLPVPRDSTARFATWMGSQRSRVTKAVAAAIVLVACFQVWHGLRGSVAAAGLVKDAVQGEVWRLLTAGMLHANLWHLAGNVGALLALGRIVEVLAHWSRLVVVFLFSILWSSLLSMLLLPKSNSVGASGGLMGLLGFLIVVGMRLPDQLPPRFGRSLIVGTLWIAVSGVLAYTVIDNAGHAGGLLGGIAMGLLLVPRTGTLPLELSPRMMRAGYACGATLMLVIVACLALLARGA